MNVEVRLDVTQNYASCPDAESYRERSLAWAVGDPIPVFTSGRAELLLSMRASALLYEQTAEVQPRNVAVLYLGEERPVSEGVRRLLRPVVRIQLTTAEDLPEGTDLLVVGRYEDLGHEAVARAVELARQRGSRCYFLTGRDDQSLTWMVAKQFLRPSPTVVATGIFSGASNVPIVGEPGTDTVFIGERDIDEPGLSERVQGTWWRQVVFHGHGTEDSINLGESTICGLNGFVQLASAGGLRPKCGYGLGCYKPDDKVIDLRSINTVSVVLASCCNATFRPMGYYDPKYLLMLNGIDGPAQHLLVAPAVHDMDAAELVAMLDVHAAGEAVSGVPRLADVHPFPAFVEIGLPQADAPAQAEATLPDTSHLADVAARATWLSPQPLRSGNKGVVRSLEQLRDKIHHEFGRPMRGNPLRWQALERSVASDVQSIDVRLAAQIARDPEDPVLDFPQYYGDRSVVDETTVTAQTCMCGLEALEWKRNPLLPGHPETTAMLCPRCGDVRFALPGAPQMSLTVDDAQVIGGDIEADVELVAERDQTVHFGLFAPRYIREAYPTPQPQRLRLRAGEGRTAHVTLRCAADVTPQAYYVTAFAVSELSLTTVRQRFGLHPDEEKPH